MEFIFEGKPHVMAQKVYDRIVNKCGCEPENVGKGYTFADCTECGKKFHKWKTNVIGRCCVCRALRRKIVITEGVFAVKDGYPKTTAIPTLAKLEAYYEQDLMTCLYCGHEFSMLWQHLAGAHETTAEEYKLEFGLPLSRGLTSKAKHKACIQQGKESYENGNDAIVKYWEDNTRENRNKASYGAVHSPALQEKARATAVHMVNTPNHVSHRQNKVDGYCSECGILITDKKYTEMSIITKSCFILCKKHRAEHHEKSQRKWCKKKGIDYDEFRRECTKRYQAKQKRKK